MPPISYLLHKTAIFLPEGKAAKGNVQPLTSLQAKYGAQIIQHGQCVQKVHACTLLAVLLTIFKGTRKSYYKTQQ